MIHYRISYAYPNRQLIDFELRFNTPEANTYLQLPSWRPGRYELGNFAKYIQQLSMEDTAGKAITFKKVNKDRWQVNTKENDILIVKYRCYAAEMNAGSSWLDEEQIYINFINCAFFPEGRQQEKYKITLDLPEDYQIACGLEQVEKFVLEAPSFYHLVESPLVASAQLTHWQYEVAGSRFHLWFNGNVMLEKEATLRDFRNFTEAQIESMGDFPCEDYHFIYQFLPYRAYHGVEHYNSTLIILGAAEEIRQDSKLYESFLGVSSHELFHTWNIIRIRPKEMYPYDYTKENYFTTGYVAEGITTYYGDLYLARGGVISKEEYLQELNRLFKRHFENFGRFYYSLAASSLDLWLDGYVPGTPNRKVSIYVKGGIVSLMLDLSIRQLSQNRYSLDDLMRSLWNNYAKEQKGYSPQDIISIASKLAGKPMDDFFEKYIEGVVPVEEELNALLHTIGCQLYISPSESLSERYFGFRTAQREDKLIVSHIEPDSPADRALSREDEIVAINSQKCNIQPNDLLTDKDSIEITLLRRQKLHTVTLAQDGNTYFHQYSIVQKEEASEQQKESFSLWLNKDF